MFLKSYGASLKAYRRELAKQVLNSYDENYFIALDKYHCFVLNTIEDIRNNFGYTEDAEYLLKVFKNNQNDDEKLASQRACQYF